MNIIRIKYHHLQLNKQAKINIIFTVALIISIWFHITNPITTIRNKNDNKKIKSHCKCRKDVFLKAFNTTHYLVNKKYHINSYFENNIHNIMNIDHQSYLKNYSYTCSLYNVLRRGPNQRVISFSIFNSNAKYLKPLLILANAIKQYYPGWIIRVYHDSNIDHSIICEYECKEDIIDFCNVDEMPSLVNKINLAYYKARYPHEMMWRWYPIGDDFVDYFMSRDSDSIAIQREKDSVDVWLFERKNALFHIMRDHPLHNKEIIGGMWGYANERNRTLGKIIYELILSKSLKLNQKNLNNKDYDQYFLSNFVWPIAKKSATVHDSYNCKYLGGEPFPTKRPEDKFCFASCSLPCCDQTLNQKNRKMDVCPVECRPKDHQDWIYC